MGIGIARLSTIAGAALLAAFGSASPAMAACDVTDNGIPEGSIATRLPPRLGDPGGVRGALAERGILVGANYIGEVLGNPSGGIQQSAHYDGRLDLYMNIDFEKMAGWKGLCFHVNGYQIHGTSITAENIGSLMPVSFIEATEATRLFELWFEQSLFNDRVSIRFGQLAADSEFLLSEGGGYFINGTWGWPSITADNLPSGGPAYPLATPGIRLQVKPTDHVTMRVGLFNGDPVGPCDGDPQRCNDNGLDFRLKDPPLLMSEGSYEYTPNGLRGLITVGGWYHFDDFEHQRYDAANVPIAVSGNPGRLLDGNYGFYGIIDQLIYRIPGDEAKGIAIFARVIGSPSDRNQVDFYAEGGLTFTGMIPHRPDDALAIGYAYTGISGAARAFDEDSLSPVVRDYEGVLEVSYTAQLCEGWTLQPDFQYFWNPGGKVPDETGLRPVDDATLGLRTTVTY
jgi:porin